jgi:hypothetical protein
LKVLEERPARENFMNGMCFDCGQFVCTPACEEKAEQAARETEMDRWIFQNATN